MKGRLRFASPCTRLGSAVPWFRGDYQLLTETQLNECVEIFLAARELVRRKILGEARARHPSDDPQGGDPPPPM